MPLDGDPKLAAPPLRHDVLPRERLLTRLLGPPDEHLVAIIGPPGYGKTTLLSQWLARERRAVAWLTIDAADTDPQVLLTYLAGAIDRAIGLPPAVKAIGGRIGSPVLSTAVPRLASALHRREQPLVLMVDDVHVLASSAGLDTLAMFMGYAPAHVTVVVAGRHDPGLPLARWRAAGRLLELGPDDLALDETEVEPAVRLMDSRLDRAAIMALHHATEGWPAALYLAVRTGVGGAAARVVGAPGAAAVGILGTMARHDIGAYLDAELLRGKDDRTRAFLVQTAILDRLSPGVCDAVTAGQDSGPLLDHLAATDLLVSPVDATGRWFRYHTLLREHLLEVLEREDVDVAVLHGRAADWFSAHGMPETAIEHRLAAADLDGAAALAASVSLPTIRAGRIATFDRWIGAVGDARLVANPDLAAVAAIAHLLRGRAAEAEVMARLMERGIGLMSRSESRDASAEATAALARALLARHGLADALDDARLAVERLPEGSGWTPVATVVLGCLLALQGDDDEADEVLRAAEATARPMAAGRTLVVSNAVRALIATRRRAWTLADGLAEEAVSVATSYGYRGEVADALAFAVAAYTATRRGDPSGARQALSAFQASSAALTPAAPWLSLLALGSACRAYLAIADPAGARTMIRHAEDIIRHRPDLGVLVADVATLRGQVDAMPAGVAGASTLTPAEIRVLLLLPTHLSVPEIAERLYVSTNTVRTQVQSIYGKLGATSRSETVEIAVSVGLLEPLPVLASR